VLFCLTFKSKSFVYNAFIIYVCVDFYNNKYFCRNPICMLYFSAFPVFQTNHILYDFQLNIFLFFITFLIKKQGGISPALLP